MGAELSKTNGTNAPIRRVGSTSSFERQRSARSKTPGFPTSASTTSLSTMALAHNNGSSNGSQSGSSSTRSSGIAAQDAPRHHQSTPVAPSGVPPRRNSLSNPGALASKFMDNPMFQSLRGHASHHNRSGHGEGPPSSASGGGGMTLSSGDADQTVESLDLAMIEWEGYVMKKGHLVRNWKTRYFTLEGNLLSCTLCVSLSVP